MPSTSSALPSPAAASVAAGSAIRIEAETAADRRQVLLMIGVASVFYFFLAALRYYSFRAGATDLGIFDQAVYLISRGIPPRSSIISMHILADHASWLLYPCALFYLIYPTVLWLFALQAVALAGAAWPVWRLSRIAGIPVSTSKALVLVFLVYPAVLMPNLHDFHCDIFLVPAILAAVLCARTDRPVWFTFWIVLALGTKEVFSITIAATGLWLLLIERRRLYGTIALLLGVGWFILATHWLIPHFGAGHQFNGYRFFAYMGNTPGAILKTMILHPAVPLRFLISRQTLLYLIVMGFPVIWGLSPRYMLPLLPALPALAINLLSNSALFRSPFYHYSVPIGPFVFLAVIATLTAGHGWLRSGRAITLWVCGLIVLSALGRSTQLNFHQSVAGASGADRWHAIALVDDDGGVLATHQIAAHLVHRRVCQFIYDPSDDALRYPPENQIDWVLLDYNEDSLMNLGDYGVGWLRRYQADPRFKMIFNKDGLYVFHRVVSG